VQNFSTCSLRLTLIGTFVETFLLLPTGIPWLEGRGGDQEAGVNLERSRGCCVFGLFCVVGGGGGWGLWWLLGLGGVFFFGCWGCFGGLVLGGVFFVLGGFGGRGMVGGGGFGGGGVLGGGVGWGGLVFMGWKKVTQGKRSTQRNHRKRERKMKKAGAARNALQGKEGAGYSPQSAGARTGKGKGNETKKGRKIRDGIGTRGGPSLVRKTRSHRKQKRELG